MVIVDTAGKVEDDIQVVDSVPMLDQAAIDAVHQWTFTPARDDGGNPMRVSLQVRVPFTLRSSFRASQTSLNPRHHGGL